MTPAVGRVPSLILFDLDGTVWDSAPGILDSLNRTLSDFGIAPTSPGDHGSFLGPPLMLLLETAGIAPADLDAARTTYRTHYAARGEANCRPYDGIHELLHKLRSDGHLLATATSKGIHAAQRMLDQFEMTPLFDIVAGAPMTASHDAKREVIRDALREAGFHANASERAPDPRPVMVGDRNFDIEGGRYFGMETIGVTWGYAVGTELADAGAETIVSTVDQLQEVLLNTTPATV